MAVYRPALDGEFISDDAFYIVSNPYIQSLSTQNLAAILDPGGPPSVLTANYAPVHLFAHALEWKFFGTSVRGYHVVNVLLHLSVTLLVFCYLRATGIGPLVAALGGIFFLLHPANVETVAWIFQLKTIFSTGLGLASLLIFAGSPLLATVLFALALLTKISAAFALPVLVVMLWCREQEKTELRASWPWLAAWVTVLCLIAIPVWDAISRTTLHHTATNPDFLIRAQTIVSIAMRYLAMAATSYGVSAFQQPAPVLSMLNPWWIGGMVALMFLSIRIVILLRRRDPELIHWTFAVASFVPVSQVFPFPYPVADHYLYAILPGLIGVFSIFVERGLERFGSREARILVVGVVIAICAGFGVRSHQRAAIWVSMFSVSQDAALHYPDGLHAQVIESYEAAKIGEAIRSADALRRAFEQGYRIFEHITGNPSYASVRNHPRFRAVLADMARWWIARERELSRPSVDELLTFSRAHHLIGEQDLAIDRLEQALARGGGNPDLIQAELDQRRFEKRLAERPK